MTSKANPTINENNVASENSSPLSNSSFQGKKISFFEILFQSLTKESDKQFLEQKSKFEVKSKYSLRVDLIIEIFRSVNFFIYPATKKNTLFFNYL